jgi:Plasmid encoded RepA protein
VSPGVKRPRLLVEHRDRLAREGWAIEQQEAREAGTLAFLARIVVQCSLPHSDPGVSSFERVNGRFRLALMAPPSVGLPIGKIPRLLLTWVTTEAVRTRSPRLNLGSSLSSFMGVIGLAANGGARGNVGRFRSQMLRLFSTAVSCRFEAPEEGSFQSASFTVTNSVRLWWKPNDPDQVNLWGSEVVLSTEFYESIVERPIPVDLRALRALRSPLQLDLYAWLSHRASYLRRTTLVPWESLALQFGADYRRLRDFRASLIDALGPVLHLYPAARVSPTPAGLELRPSPPHVARRSFFASF